LKKSLLLLPVLLACAAHAEFRLRDIGGKSLELTENGAPVFVYNYGTMLKEGAPADRARCCYLHPVYAPNGAVVTDDFPKDHWHHRGISWMWPVVKVEGKTYDLWTIKGILARFEKWHRKQAGSRQAAISFQDGWYIGERKVVQEDVEIVAHPVAAGRRVLDFTIRLRAMQESVEIAGEPDANKGYGGFNIRFAPRTGTTIAVPGSADIKDSDLQPQPWAELTGDFNGKRAATRITIDPGNPAAPGWCLRHYGFLGVEFPGLQAYKLDRQTPLVMKFRVSLAEAPSLPKVLVYTRNFTSEGKGYVHDNIAASVAAIRKMGAESGFGVDASDDPAVFTDANLKQHRALVFSNSNNEAFSNDAQRQAFQRYIQGGGGFVGIHSASGSERNWPYFWSVVGGKFLRHPKFQPFQVRVKDPQHPAVKGVPAVFDWADECYYLDHINPDIKVLLVTDPGKIVDPQKATYPGDRFGDSLPLAWYHEFDGGREFYLALGHKKEDYQNPLLYNLIRGGINWAMERNDAKR
jgi:type 1 glutamine amidotransferase